MSQVVWRLAAYLGGIWIMSLIYGELIAFYVPGWTCSWPLLPNNQNVSNFETSMENSVRVALIADPQLTDRTSYGMAPGSLALKMTQFYSDIYMRRAFRSSVLALEPDAIIFLGDLFDGGPYLSDGEWEDSLSRFNHVFDQSERGLKSRSRKIPTYILPGNHDLGYVQVEIQKPEVMQRYKRIFGETDHKVTIGMVDFVFVDAQALDGSEAELHSNMSWSFIQAFSKGSTHAPRVLLTHIPLYRPDNTPCGYYRASPVINQRITKFGPRRQDLVYQNYLTNETSSKLLESIKPVAVFSGHDHDQCTISHQLDGKHVKEYTVGTFSWLQGNLYPSFMMLSVAPMQVKNPNSSDSVVSSLCFLPAQDFIYAWYVVLLIVCLACLLLWPTHGLHMPSFFKKAWDSISNLDLISKNTKEKDDDVEWEMIWDAEGAMHLISKGSARHGTNAVGSPSSEKSYFKASCQKTGYA
ncbi:hypothetical protein O6H91_09G045800 [Diphasiastrum complanatum]|uniref:Uncharacterized protein n=1 Tax=Diphasiastrum complanatum TaxID=34168 RepID=A0ACC2CNM6_DIPCM|nr:hypothetical protein O6H91_09G045800 [Diphasiastrum complanatum]